MAIALWRLATGCGYRTLQELFGVGMSTACTIFHEFVTAVNVALGPQYLTRPSGDEFVRIVQGFQNKRGFPQCGGAIDGTHIPIIVPKDKRNDYYNRKGWYSMVMQAVCDHRYRFYDIERGWPGKVHDARDLRNSKIFEDGEAGKLFPNRLEHIGTVDVNICLIGDPAYPLLLWIMKV